MSPAATVAPDRRKFIGGSDIAALLGIAPATWRRNTPLALYMDKIQPPKADTQGINYKRRGHRWESVVAEMLVEQLEEQGHKVEIVASNKRYVDPEYEYFACEIDFEIRLDDEKEITNVELKTVHPYKVSEWGEEGTDESPVWYTAQGQWGLGITSRISPRKRCIIAPLFGADEIRVYPMVPEFSVIDAMRDAGRQFWTEHVQPKVPPLPGGLLDLSLLFPKDVGSTLELGDNIKFVDAIAALHEITAEFKDLERRWKEAEYIIKEAMGDAAIATIGGHKSCTWKSQRHSSVDVGALKKKHPKIHKNLSRTISIRKFLLTKPKVK